MVVWAVRYGSGNLGVSGYLTSEPKRLWHFASCLYIWGGVLVGKKVLCIDLFPLGEKLVLEFFFLAVHSLYERLFRQCVVF
jgi:hypothetical protein